MKDGLNAPGGRTPRLRLRVTTAAETVLRAGHPWVFADSVREQNREGTAGELAVVYDRNDRFLAVGLFDPASAIRVRVLHRGKPATLDGAWWSTHLALAIERRRGLFDERTNGYRLINGESDGWPGLVLDRYGSTFVLKLYTAAWLPRLTEVAGLIQTQLNPERIVLRLSRNIQRSFQSHLLPARSDPSAQEEEEGGKEFDGQIVCGPPLKEPVVFLETGLSFEADVLRGQKTGFFLDQRENRRTVESLARGRNVLNAFSFSGGFSLYAARGGANSTTDLDVSAHALAGAKRNLALNKDNGLFLSCRHEYVQGDAFEWLAGNELRKFDLIVLDPPSFAKRETERAAAIRAYARLASLGIAHLSGGGILVACSCSAHVKAEEFWEAVRRSAGKSRRPFHELRTTQHPPDHPSTFREAEYLKAIYLAFA